MVGFTDAKSVAQPKKEILQKGPEGGGVEAGSGWGRGADRKDLQNDELVEYALFRSDLSYPSLALSELNQLWNRPNKAEQAERWELSCSLCPT